MDSFIGLWIYGALDSNTNLHEVLVLTLMFMSLTERCVKSPMLK